MNFLKGMTLYRDAGALLAVQTAGAISQVAGGIGGAGAASTEAAQERQQGQIALTESQTDANNAAFNLTQQVQNQKLQFLANGVSIEGSPSSVIAASKNYAQTQVQSILNEGAAKYNLSQEEAANTINKGRAGIIAGLAQGAGTEASGYQKFIQGGGGTNAAVVASMAPGSNMNSPL